MAVWSPLGAPVQQAALGAWKLHRSFSSSCRITLTTDGSHADWQRACGKSLWLTLPLLDLSSLCFTPSISPPLPLSSLLSSSAPGFPAGLEGSGDVSCDLSPVEQLGMRTTLRCSILSIHSQTLRHAHRRSDTLSHAHRRSDTLSHAHRRSQTLTDAQRRSETLRVSL